MVRSAAVQPDPPGQECAQQGAEPSAAALQGLQGRTVRQGPRERTARQGPREHAVLQDLRGLTAQQGPPERIAAQAAGAPRAGEALPGEEAAGGT